MCTGIIIINCVLSPICNRAAHVWQQKHTRVWIVLMMSIITQYNAVLSVTLEELIIIERY